MLDEASSALDTITEQALMNAINQLGKELTILIIAHRLSTVKRCDRVIMLADGLVEADGAPDFVINDF